jgi:PAS domain S-box-containing protein
MSLSDPHMKPESSVPQAALGESEAKGRAPLDALSVRAMLEQLPVGVWFADGQGKITYGNETGQRIWAGAHYVGPEQFGEYKAWWRDTGQPLAPDDWAVARAIRTGQSSLDELLEIECFDGTHKIIRNSAVVIPGQSDELTGVVVLNEDVTEDIRREEALREALERVRLATTAAGLGVFEWDVSADRAFWENERMYEIFGRQHEEGAINKSEFTAHVLHPDDQDGFERDLADSMQPGRFFTSVCRIRRRNDPNWRWIEFLGRFALAPDGRPLRLVATVADITDRKRAEEERERLVMQLQSLLAITHDVASRLELEPLLDVILDRLQTMVGCSGCAIYLLEGDILVAMDYHGPLPRDQVLQMRFSWPGAVGVAQAIQSREPVIIEDVEGDSALARAWREAALPEQRKILGDARSWMGVPLVAKDQVIGLLRLDHPEPGHFTPRHAGLAMAIADQAAVAVENARLYERAQRVATIEERQRIARELHDSVSQVLYGIVLSARTARVMIDRDPAKAIEPLDYVFSLAEAGLAEMRALIFELRPDALQSEGLVHALERRVEVLRTRHGLQVVASFCEEPECGVEIKDAIYRVAQEAMHNTTRHAQATRVEVSLSSSPTALKLEVVDDGIGFDPTGSYPGHMGLRSMRERVARLGGTLNIESAPGHGALVRLEIPM